jgi:hypothetical protein
MNKKIRKKKKNQNIYDFSTITLILTVFFEKLKKKNTF